MCFDMGRGFTLSEKGGSLGVHEKGVLCGVHEKGGSQKFTKGGSREPYEPCHRRFAGYFAGETTSDGRIY